MKILQLVNRIPYPLTDGGNIATWNLAQALEKQGHQITMACLNTRKHYQNPAVIQHKLYKTAAVNLNTDIHLLNLIQNLFSPIPYIAERFISEEFKSLLKKLLKDEKYDLIQAEGLYMCAYADTIRACSDAPFVLRAHNIEYKIWERLAKNTTQPFKKFYLERMFISLKKYESQCFQKMDAILFFTPEDQKWAYEMGYSGISEIIPSGVDIDTFEYKGTPRLPASIGFLGSLEWRPNQDAVRWFISEIFPEIKKQIPEATFYLAGKNMPDHLLKDLNLNGVIYMGQVPDAAKFLHSLEVFVVPLRSGGGMRLKILEGMAASSCILSTDIGAEGIEIQDTHEFLRGNTASELAQKACYLLQNPLIRKSLSEKASLVAKSRYGWDAISRRTSEFYQTLL